MSATKTVTESSFADDVLMSDKPVLVDFWAEWCGPCRQVAPVLEQIANEYPSITVAKVNIDEHPGIASQQGITSIPTLTVFSGGRPVKTIVGAKPKSVLVAELSEYLG